MQFKTERWQAYQDAKNQPIGVAGVYVRDLEKRVADLEHQLLIQSYVVSFAKWGLPGVFERVEADNHHHLLPEIKAAIKALWADMFSNED